MKKRIIIQILYFFLLPAALSLPLKLAASDYYRGGMIEYRSPNRDSLEIIMTLYAGCNADIQNPNNGYFADQKIYIRSGTDTVVFYFPLCNHYLRADICPDTMSWCLGGPLLYSSMVFEYKKTVALSLFSGCDLNIFWQAESSYGGVPPRSSYTSTGAANTIQYLTAFLNPCVLTVNNSPIFTNRFPDAVKHNSDFFYNYGITIDEPEDDSVYFESIAPLIPPGIPANYSANFSNSRPLTFLGFPNESLPLPAGIHFDNLCGNVSFRPTRQNEVGVFALKVSRFVKRNDSVYKVSEVMYEHEVRIASSYDFKYYFPTPNVRNSDNCIEKSLYPDIVCGLNTPRQNPEKLICTNDSILLSAEEDTSYIYVWRQNGNLIPGASGSSYWANDSGVYTVDVTNIETGCFKTSSETRVVFYDGELPQISLTDNGKFCLGDTAGILREDKNYNWLLWKRNNTAYSQDTTLLFKTLQSGTYTLDVINKQGCRVSSNPVQVAFNLPITSPLFAEKNKIFCDVFTDTLKPVIPLIEYKWQIPPVSSADMFIINAPGKYYLSGKDTGNCPVSDSIEVFIVLPPTVDLGNDTSYCYVENIQLLLWGTDTAIKHYKYKWNQSFSDTLPTFTAQDTGKYILEVTDSNSCSSKDSIHIYKFPAIELDLGNDTTICGQESFTLQAPNGFIRYVWSTTDTLPAIEVHQAGEYRVKVRDANSCEAEAGVFVSFDKIPEVFLVDTSLCERNFITFQVPDFYEEYLWSNGSKDFISEYRDTGFIWVKVRNACGEAEAETHISGCSYEPAEIFIPNAFSPTGNQLNDRFRIFATNIRTFEIKIFNRWGEIVYESKDLNEGWDGNYAGKPAPQEVYGYLISIKALDGERRNYRGNLTLLR